MTKEKANNPPHSYTFSLLKWSKIWQIIQQIFAFVPFKNDQREVGDISIVFISLCPQKWSKIGEKILHNCSLPLNFSWVFPAWQKQLDKGLWSLVCFFFGSIMPFLWTRNYRIQTTALQHLLKTRRNKVTHSYVKKYNARHIYTQHNTPWQTFHRPAIGSLQEAPIHKNVDHFYFLLSSSFFSVSNYQFLISLNISIQLAVGRVRSFSKATVADLFFIFMTADAKISNWSVGTTTPSPSPLQSCIVAFSGGQLFVWQCESGGVTFAWVSDCEHRWKI